MGRKPDDLTGIKFGRLIAVRIDRIEKKARGSRVYWLCKCECGGAIVARSDGLRCGDNISCGCRKTTHGLTGSPEYRSWSAMRARCLDPDHPQFDSYGGRGIFICARWASFQMFRLDMGARPSPAHTIERIDNESGYMPRNCKWADKKEQARNRRSTKLNLDDVKAIRSSSGVSQAVLGDRFGVHQSNISRVLSGDTWSE